jgi:hypothetical protein
MHNHVTARHKPAGFADLLGDYIEDGSAKGDCGSEDLGFGLGRFGHERY